MINNAIQTSMTLSNQPIDLIFIRICNENSIRFFNYLQIKIHYSNSVAKKNIILQTEYSLLIVR